MANKSQAITTPICNAKSGCKRSYDALPFTAKFFDLAFTIKFKSKIQKIWLSWNSKEGIAIPFSQYAYSTPYSSAYLTLNTPDAAINTLILPSIPQYPFP